MHRRPALSVISLGGTIASTPVGDGSGAVPTLTAEDLITAVPPLADLAQVSGVSFRAAASPELGLQDVVQLHSAVIEEVRRGADGVVVTQGTDTLEETAFALDLMCDAAAPVVVTGAMRPARELSADGPANLLAAARVALSEQARGLGCLVVLGDEVHWARLVRKTHTTSLEAFQSPSVGAIGWLSEDQVRIVLRPSDRPLIGVPGPTLKPHAVAIVKLGLGDTPKLIEQLPGLGYRGAVVEALGGGHVPQRFLAPLAEVAATLPVAFTSRTGAGSVLRKTYAFPGSEQDLLRAGLMSAGMLDAPKTRMLLMLLLAGGAGRRAISASLERIGGG